jgi:transcriptional regulator with XRE-family HTH domain
MRSNTVDRLLKSTPEDVKIFVDLYADLVVRVNQLMEDKGVSKEEQSEELNKNPSEISKWLNGEHDLTLRSLAKLQAELGEPLLQVPKKETNVEYSEGEVRKVHTFVTYQKMETKIEGKVIPWQPIINAEPSNELSYAG